MIPAMQRSRAAAALAVASVLAATAAGVSGQDGPREREVSLVLLGIRG